MLAAPCTCVVLCFVFCQSYTRKIWRYSEAKSIFWWIGKFSCCYSIMHDVFSIVRESKQQLANSAITIGKAEEKNCPSSSEPCKSCVSIASQGYWFHTCISFLFPETGQVTALPTWQVFLLLHNWVSDISHVI